MAKTKEIVAVHPEQQLDKKLVAVQKMVAAIKIVDQTTLDGAGDMLLKIKGAITEVEEALDPQCKSAYNTWQVALAQKKKYLTPYQTLESAVKGEIGRYTLEQEEIREAEEQRLQALAEEEEDRTKAKLLKQADAARKKGNVDKAEELEEQAEMVMVPQPQMTNQVTQVSGVTSTKETEIEVVDLMALIKAIAKGTVKINVDALFSVKISIIKQYVNATGVTSLDGCRFTKQMKISASRKGGK
jgi:hypothetical protein